MLCDGAPIWRDTCITDYGKLGSELGSGILDMDKLTARRKVLRGSLSAPLVLTVASPAALAQTTYTSCLVNGAPAPSSIFLTGTDNYYRVSVSLYNVQFKTGNMVGPYYVYPASPPFPSLPASPSPAYYWVGNATDPNGNNGTLVSDPGIKKVNAAGSQNAVAYVGSDGTLKGYGFPATSGGGSIAYQSCYDSLLIQPQ